jgi:TonB family protein
VPIGGTLSSGCLPIRPPARYNKRVYSERASLIPFLLLSFLIHFVVLASWPKSAQRLAFEEPLPVAFLPAPEPRPQPKKEPAEARGRPAPPKIAPPKPERPPEIAEKTTPAPLPEQKSALPLTEPKPANPEPEPIRSEAKLVSPEPKPIGPEPEPVSADSKLATAEPKPIGAEQEPPEAKRIAPTMPAPVEPEAPPGHEVLAKREAPAIVQRPLPTLKELLPPVTWAPSGDKPRRNEEAVRLDTKEPQYVSYFTSIKRAIELVWEYPEAALLHGLQGKLVLEFTVLGNGRLEKTRLLRSSGFPVLDQEAVRAVKAASPFHPIPQWIGRERLDIIASFEYHDNRIKYHVTP